MPQLPPLQPLGSSAAPSGTSALPPLKPLAAPAASSSPAKLPALAPLQLGASASTTALAPSVTPSASGPIPASALKGSLGGGYGASNITDQYSGKPLLTYENQAAKSSQLFSDRVAPTFDPTKPQKIDPSVLHNGRMPVSASEAVRKATGGEPDEQLDHLISLELGGSNDTSNLNLEKTQTNGTQPSLNDENRIANLVANGDKTGVSYIDGQKMIAKLKGVQLPDDPDFPSSDHPLAQYYPKPNNGTASAAASTPMSAGDKALKFFPGTISTLGDLQMDPASLKADPHKAISDYVSGLKDSIMNEGANIKQAFTAPTLAGKTGAALSSVAGGVGAALSPVTSLFNAANDIPVLGTVSKLLSLPFIVMGDAGNTDAQAIVSHLPISQDAKDQIVGGMGAIVGLAGQFAVGGATEGLTDAIKAKYGEVDGATIVQKATELAKERGGFINVGAKVGAGDEETPPAKSQELTYDTSDTPRQHGDPIKFAANDDKGVEPAYKMPGQPTEPPKPPTSAQSVSQLYKTFDDQRLKAAGSASADMKDVANTYPLTDEAKKTILDNTTQTNKHIPGEFASFDNSGAGKDKINISEPQDTNTFHEMIHSWIANTKDKPDLNAFQSAFDQEKATNPVLKNIDEILSKDTHNYPASSAKDLPEERFAYVAEAYGVGGIDAVPESLRPFYKDVLSNSPGLATTGRTATRIPKLRLEFNGAGEHVIGTEGELPELLINASQKRFTKAQFLEDARGSFDLEDPDVKQSLSDYYDRAFPDGPRPAGHLPDERRSLETTGRAATQSAIDKNAAEQLKISEQNALTEKLHSEKPAPADGFMQKLKNILNPLKSQDLDVQKAFKDYTQKLTESQGLANDEAKNLSGIGEKEGLDVMHRYERGSPTPYTQDIQKQFGSLYDEARSRGLDTEHRANYLPHVYAEKPAEIQEFMKKYLAKKGVPEEQINAFMNGSQEIPDSTVKRLGLNPSFVKSRTFPTYADAMEAGLHPKFTHPAQLAGYYRDAMEHSIASRQFVDELVGKGKLVTAEEAPTGYKPVNLEFAQQGYYAKPRLAQMLNGLFNDSNSKTFWQSVMHVTGQASATLQKILLTTGIPGTDINVHSIGQFFKEITAGNFKNIAPLVRANFDSASIKYFEDNRDVIQRMAAHNLDIGSTVADYPNLYKNLAKPTIGEAYQNGGVKSVAGYIARETGQAFEKTFTKKNFTSYMPQMYISTFKDATEHFLAQGMKQDEADGLAADVVKAFHGLIGNVGRAPATEDGLSTVFFAPKFRESIVNTLWNSLRSVTTDISNPTFYQNRRLLGGMTLTYGMYAGANKYLNGNYMWQNPSTHQFDLQIPTGNGNFAYLPFMPSFLTVPRNIIGGALSTAQGDLKGATQQFTSVLAAPIQLFGQLYANKDYYGRAIYADTDPGTVKAQKIAQYLGLNTVPPFVKEAVTYIENKGTTPLYQSITAGMALPIKYGTQAKNNTSDYYQALTNNQNDHAQALASFKPTFDKIQALITSGQNDQAQQLVNQLSDSDYSLYKGLKSAASSKTTIQGEQQFMPTYQQIKSLLQSGKTDQAQSIVNGLSDSDYKLYQKLKAKGL